MLERLYGEGPGLVPKAVLDDMHAYNFTLEQRLSYVRNALGIASADNKVSKKPFGAAGPVSYLKSEDGAGLWVKSGAKKGYHRLFM